MRAIADKLVHDLANEGSIIVYHQSFEKKCLEEFSAAFLYFVSKQIKDTLCTTAF